MNSNSAFNKLIEEINNSSDNVQRNRGTMFEELITAYLRYEPTYQNLYKNVWMLKDVPDTLYIPKKDTGVDIVAQQYDNTFTAVQVKLNKYKVKKSEINSFIAELGKDYYQHGMLISTTDFDYNAMSTIHDNSKDISVIGLSDLRNSKIDWNQFNFSRPENIHLNDKKTLRRYQREALDNAMSYYKDHDRGQLIMAPGTGKTFTSLKIAEAMAKKKKGQFRILYLVPSIQLLTQTLRGWNADTSLSMTSMAITSDRDASRSKSDNEVVKGEYIGYPATTSSKQFLNNWDEINQQANPSDLLITFSTYQSIDVVSKAQNNGFPKFDLIIADEAHRTTGVHELGKDASFFTKVHSNKNVRSDRRLYQTATPKVYGDKARKNAKDRSIVLSSMDDKSKFGDVFYRLGFGQAISYGILTDYKVMTLAVDEAAIHHNMQNIMSNPENGLNINDIGRIIGIWNGMMRRNGYKNPVKNSEYSGSPLKRAIAFTSTIDDSKKVSKQFENVVNEYLESSEKQKTHLTMRHADGQMSALEKGETLDWLSDSNKPENEARIVSNARFLTEGVDIPALDAIIFLAPKRSQVDIVQAVGRIMRKSQGKDYGYIILPIVIPSGEKPENILDNNKDYETVWQVINALRSVDERFEAIVDTINTHKKNKRFPMIGVGKAPKKANNQQNSDNSSYNLSSEPKSEQTELNLNWNEYRAAIYGKIVQKVGDRQYLDNWSKDVANIAQHQMQWIREKLQDKNDSVYTEFQNFVKSLQYNINNGIDKSQAVEMLSQHLITKPIFDALFSKYDFVKNNPVSSAMESMIKELEKAGFAKEQESLTPLYESVNIMAEGLETPEDRQKIIIKLYNKFFKTAFHDTTQQLGIVFTPIEVVDFIIKSVDDILHEHFSKSLASEGIHILDPFTGTGTFMVRTLQYLKQQMDAGQISITDIVHKYTKELHANEIILLSYYIAAINIESTFANITNKNGKYNPFNGIVLTDTFESTEESSTLDDDYFGTNDKRLKRQQESPITAIISNPPYSAKQKNEDNNQTKINYPKLDNSLRKSWVDTSSATNKAGLFDSYMRALRWASDRIHDKGVVGFITNNSFINGASMDGMRKSMIKEFSDIYIIDLKGTIRQQSKKQKEIEGENIFDIQTGVSIIFLVKNKNKQKHNNLHYLNIGNGLSKQEKLSRLNKWNDFSNVKDKFKNIIPNSKGDWINQRNSNFDKFTKLGDKKTNDSLFIDYSSGITTGRDSWAINFSKNNVINNMKTSIKYYNRRLGNTQIYNIKTNKITWTRSLKKRFERNEKQSFDKSRIYIGMYRPFTKKYVYYSKEWVDMQYKMPKIMPNNDSNNLMISLANKSAGKRLTTLITNKLPDANLFVGRSQNFPKVMYDQFGNYSSIRPELLKRFNLSSEEMFYYIYGILHSPDYTNKYFDDLSKSLPRIPNVRNKEQYIKIGRQLADLHINYENQPSWNEVKVEKTNDHPRYYVEKMKHPKYRNKNGKRVKDLTKIIFNDDITISGIPKEAYKYIVNNRPAIEWIINQYQVTVHKDSDVKDDPNKFSNDPKYILRLILSIITVSMKTLKLISELPKL